MNHKITGVREAPEIPAFRQGGARGHGTPRGGGFLFLLFIIAAAVIVANQVKKENPELDVPSDQELFDKLPDDAKEVFTESYITTQEQLHLKTYFTRLEAVKEGCRLFLPPGNSVGMPQEHWRKLLEELQ